MAVSLCLDRERIRERGFRALSEMQNNLLAHVRRQWERCKVVCVCAFFLHFSTCMYENTNTVSLLIVLCSGSRGLVDLRLCGLRAYSYQVGHTYAIAAVFILCG